MKGRTEKKENPRKELGTNPTWELVYRKVLEDNKTSFPENFWDKNIEQKGKQLLRYYTHKHNIPDHSISFRNPRKLIQKAKLQEPLQKFSQTTPTYS